MKAREIRVLPALDPGESYVEPSFLLVETTVGQDGEPATTIEHFASSVVGEQARWQVSTLGQAVSLTHSAALEWAVSFAASRQVPIVYHRDDSTSERYAATPYPRVESASSAAK